MKGISHRAVLAVFMCALIAPAHASALEPLATPVPGAIALRFGETYVAAGSCCTHRGLDILGTAGEAVAAPCRGRVRFAGLVPADGGGRCGAVTVETADGALVTVMPLQDLWVSAGAEVVPGTGVGELASAGDASCESPHVHLSVRVEGRYVDPEPLLAAGGSADEEAPGFPVTGDTGETSVQRPTPSGSPAVDGTAAAGEVPGIQPASEGQAEGLRAERSPHDPALNGASPGAWRGTDAACPAAGQRTVRQSIFRSIQAMQQTSAAARWGARPVAAERNRAVQTLGVAAPPSALATRSAVLSIAAGVLSVAATMRARRKVLGVQRVV
ncbi:M23 family metallopeptidase [Coriobacteriia bacterium Es71-Z0120]|uniref:M23 family metallopeptidase n=1 Tax=Parvivirga hydrogeniphila TaxID=2939460 RepID=UPI002260D83C|nr:M23 family metallopeptidase [Parvivirga hydrogeniphila]MCL4078141.1 M23 family metallopeptidase [Parvivirga hydrogeniphila]